MKGYSLVKFETEEERILFNKLMKEKGFNIVDNRMADLEYSNEKSYILGELENELFLESFLFELVLFLRFDVKDFLDFTFFDEGHSFEVIFSDGESDLTRDFGTTATLDYSLNLYYYLWENLNKTQPLNDSGSISYSGRIDRNSIKMTEFTFDSNLKDVSTKRVEKILIDLFKGNEYFNLEGFSVNSGNFDFFNVFDDAIICFKREIKFDEEISRENNRHLILKLPEDRECFQIFYLSKEQKEHNRYSEDISTIKKELIKNLSKLEFLSKMFYD